MASIFNDLLYSIFPNKTKYLTYGNGNSPIILSAPHGGNIKPLDIPYRKQGNRSKDTYTRRLIQKVSNLLTEKPYYIYSNIHRSRVDLNRNIKEAAQGNKKAELVWYAWNKTLAGFTKDVILDYGKGLYIDIHSHNNSDQFQVGYGLPVKDYIDLKSGWEIKKHSTLFTLTNPLISEKTLCFGTGSIIDTLQYRNYKVLIPENDNDYLNGGYNIKKFSGHGIGAIQIECPIPVLKYDLDGIAISLANSIRIFSDSFL